MAKIMSVAEFENIENAALEMVKAAKRNEHEKVREMFSSLSKREQEYLAEEWLEDQLHAAYGLSDLELKCVQLIRDHEKSLKVKEAVWVILWDLSDKTLRSLTPLEWVFYFRLPSEMRRKPKAAPIAAWKREDIRMKVEETYQSMIKNYEDRVAIRTLFSQLSRKEQIALAERWLDDAEENLDTRYPDWCYKEAKTLHIKEVLWQCDWYSTSSREERREWKKHFNLFSWMCYLRLPSCERQKLR